jgi:hypothetical protein
MLLLRNLKTVMGIRGILVRVRIRGSVPLTNGSGYSSRSDSFFNDFKDAKKNYFFHIFFLLITYPQAHYLQS